MRRLDWWIGVLIVAAALLVHALMPRYEFRHMVGYSGRSFVRIDRWTGRMESGVVDARWVSNYRQAVPPPRPQTTTIQSNDIVGPVPARKQTDIHLPGVAKFSDIEKVFDAEQNGAKPVYLDEKGNPIDPLDKEIDDFLSKLPPQKKP